MAICGKLLQMRAAWLAGQKLRFARHGVVQGVVQGVADGVVQGAPFPFLLTRLGGGGARRHRRAVNDTSLKGAGAGFTATCGASFAPPVWPLFQRWRRRQRAATGVWERGVLAVSLVRRQIDFALSPCGLWRRESAEPRDFYSSTFSI